MACNAKINDERSPVDAKLFRRVMGSFATVVTVIAAEVEGSVRGMTANAFMSGSLSPPLCLISVTAATIRPMDGFVAVSTSEGT